MIVHSPGQWNVDPEKKDGFPIISAQSIVVATVRNADDAELIAASPSLLLACQMAAHFIEAGQSIHPNSDTARAILAALEKAEGKQK